MCCRCRFRVRSLERYEERKEYVRSPCRPRLSSPAEEKLTNPEPMYVQMSFATQEQERETHKRLNIPIIVRQLGTISGWNDIETLASIDLQFKQRVPIGAQVSEHSILQDFLRQQYEERTVDKVIHYMVRRDPAAAAWTVAEISAKMDSRNQEEILEALTEGSKLLKQKNPPIEEIIRAGLVPKFVKLLDVEDFAIQYTCMWVLCKITCGCVGVKVVINSGAVDGLIRMLSSPDENLTELATIALSNIAWHEPLYCHVMVEKGIVPALVNLIRPDTPTKSMRPIAGMISTFSLHITSFDAIAMSIPLDQLICHSDENVRAFAIIDAANRGTPGQIEALLNLDPSDSIGCASQKTLMIQQCGGRDTLISLLTHHDDRICKRSHDLLVTYFCRSNRASGGLESHSLEKPTDETVAQAVESLAKMFQCFICLEKAENAHLCPTCSKVGCLPCIRRAFFDHPGSCPHCRADLELHQLLKCPWEPEDRCLVPPPLPPAPEEQVEDGNFSLDVIRRYLQTGEANIGVPASPQPPTPLATPTTTEEPITGHAEHDISTELAAHASGASSGGQSGQNRASVVVSESTPTSTPSVTMSLARRSRPATVPKSSDLEGRQHEDSNDADGYVDGEYLHVIKSPLTTVEQSDSSVPSRECSGALISFVPDGIRSAAPTSSSGRSSPAQSVPTGTSRGGTAQPVQLRRPITWGLSDSQQTTASSSTAPAPSSSAPSTGGTGTRGSLSGTRGSLSRRGNTTRRSRGGTLFKR
ncbi:unnamed protein product [Cyprideis torosa]|uniref:Uncharacterized protein n=1 Tax=Cyprideis torosa TaxID=163714 RepID=A0A7R8WP30_9CRUS|nr:unnamed protein product [Cyprideis torosa]CAG0901326.1 unnamed protein product [Cyprideis torosa]